MELPVDVCHLVVEALFDVCEVSGFLLFRDTASGGYADTLRSLCLVSRQWRLAAAPALVEYLNFLLRLNRESYFRMQAFLALTAPRLGDRVRSLEVNLNDLTTDPAAETCETLVRSLPSLTTLLVNAFSWAEAVSTDPDRDVFAASPALTFCRDNPKVVDLALVLASVHAWTFRGGWTDLVAGFAPHLRRLELIDCGALADLARVVWSSCPSLEALSVIGPTLLMHGEEPAWEPTLPLSCGGLRRLDLRHAAEDVVQSSTWGHFFRASAGTLVECVAEGEATFQSMWRPGTGPMTDLCRLTVRHSMPPTPFDAPKLAYLGLSGIVTVLAHITLALQKGGFRPLRELAIYLDDEVPRERVAPELRQVCEARRIKLVEIRDGS